MDNDQDYALDIKNTLLELIADSRENIFSKEDSGDVLLVEFFFKKLDPVAVADHIVKNILPYNNEIKDRDLAFFQKNKDNIFKGLPKNKVDHFAALVESPEEKGGISEENKVVFWTYFDTFIYLGEQYKKNK